MRLIAWNIRAGGGRRVEAIARQLHAWQADAVFLSEFRATLPSRELAGLLAGAGLSHQRSTASPAAPARNELLVASRWPVRPVRLSSAPVADGRWLPVRIEGPRRLDVVALHFPLGAVRYATYMGATLEAMRLWRRRPALIAGDTNSGRPVLDEESPVFGPRHTAWFDAIEALGWRDSFRHLHPEAREFTWYSPNGRNGFRLDQAFASPALLPSVRSVQHLWATNGMPGLRRDAISDHAAVVIDLAEPTPAPG